MACDLLLNMQHQFDCPSAPPLNGPDCECGFKDLPAKFLDIRTDLPTSTGHRNWIHVLNLLVTLSSYREYGVCPKPCEVRALEECTCGTKERLVLSFNSLETLVDELVWIAPNLWNAD